MEKIRILYAEDYDLVLFTAGHANGGPASWAADARLCKPGGLKELVPTCRRLPQHAAPPAGIEIDSRESDGAAV